MTQDTEAERVFRWNFEIHASPSGGWVRSEDHDMAIRAFAAERDALRDALERIEDASRHYASCTHLEAATLAYAHESTARLAHAALTGEAKP